MRLFLATAIFLLVSTFTRAESESGVIIAYHHVATDTPPSTSLSPAAFEAHLKYLKENDFSVMGLPEMLESLALKKPLPPKAVAITFDDGYSSIYQTAFPMLQEFGYPFTLFVSTGPIDRAQSKYMSWENIKEMAAAGVTIANHLVDHPYMLEKRANEDDTQWLDRLRMEILAAENTIKMQTGQSHQLLAYPYGEYDNRIQKLVSDLGFTGVAQNSGAVGFFSDKTALPRFPLASIYANLDTAKVKFASKAFKVEQLAPISPVTSELRPVAKLKFSPDDYRRQQVACFSGGQPMQMDWSDDEDGVVVIRPNEDLNGRRSRYVCTAPDINDGRFYWYSVQWINPL
ncbi:MAG: polysaccharide deacetylase family protein [Pseudohongiellaceae bacterium]